MLSMLDLPPRARQAPNRYAPSSADVEVGEPVTAVWLDGKMYDGVVSKMNNDNTLAIDFTDGDKLGGVSRRQVLRSSNGASAADKAKARKKIHKKPVAQEKKFKWIHHGFSRSIYRPKPDHTSVAESLMFEFDASFQVHKQIGPRVTDRVSLHDIVNGNMPIQEKNMHAKALSDFLKMLLLQKPSANSMEALIESSGIDPMGALTNQQRAERQAIYEQHMPTASSESD